MERERWRILESTYPIDTRFLRLRKDRVQLPNGSVVDDYYVRESRGFVIVCAVTHDGNVVLVRQYKHGIGKELVELPAGAIDANEDPRAGALRELREETGYTADDVEHVRTFVVEPTNSTSLAHLFLARSVRKTHSQELDPTEKIEVFVVSPSELREKVRSGEIDCMPHVAAIYLLFDLGLL